MVTRPKSSQVCRWPVPGLAGKCRRPAARPASPPVRSVQPNRARPPIPFLLRESQKGYGQRCTATMIPRQLQRPRPPWRRNILECPEDFRAGAGPGAVSWKFVPKKLIGNPMRGSLGSPMSDARQDCFKSASPVAFAGPVVIYRNARVWPACWRLPGVTDYRLYVIDLASIVPLAPSGARGKRWAVLSIRSDRSYLFG